jgi:hypothetical protein
LYHFKQAKKVGVTIEDMHEVVELANRISELGDKGMFEFVSKTIKKRSE